MEFDLSPELIDQIIFAMENQEKDYVLDTKTLELVPIDELPPELVEDEDRLIQLPEWYSVHGYNLMEKFVANLRNPLFRETLREILARGKGVFRQFKDTIKQRKDIERLWFSFKDREMKRVVLEWYNQLRESWGLERIGTEPLEETEELILSDFVIRPEGGKHLEIIRELDRRAFQENFGDEGPGYAEYMYEVRRYGVEPEVGSESVILIAETPVGEFAGFIWGVETRTGGNFTVSRLLQLYVVREYRGLGLAKVLLHRFCVSAYERSVDRVTIELLGSGYGLLDSLKTAGFRPLSETLELDLDGWDIQRQ
jgi:GNAT superfamily N-acetyltransferase